MDLEEQVAVVTGGAGGLGRVVAGLLAREGAIVVVADRDADAAAEAADELSALGTTTVAVHADMCVPEHVHRLVGTAATLGPLRVLVNNAGGWGDADDQYPAAREADWRSVIELNLLGPMLALQLALPPMQQSGGGAVVSVASSAATGTKAYGSPTYAASKAGLVRLTTSLAGLEETHLVRVGCVVPGWIGLPRAYDELAAMPPGERETAGPLAPPDLVADAVLDFVHSRHAGRVLEIDGTSTRYLDVDVPPSSSG